MNDLPSDQYWLYWIDFIFNYGLVSGYYASKHETAKDVLADLKNADKVSSIVLKGLVTIG